LQQFVMKKTRLRLASLLLILLPAMGGTTGCQRSRAAGASVAADARPGAGVVQRGPLLRRLHLSGEVDAVEAIDLKVPRVPNGKVTLRTLPAEGAEVRAGDVVVDLDDTVFAAQLRERTLALSQSEIDLQRQVSQNGLLEADKALEVERKRALMKRAEIDADVPPGILPKRDYLEKQLALRRARVDLDRAEEALAALRTQAELDLAIKRLAVEKTRRDVKHIEGMIAALRLRAPVGGTVIIGDHLQEGRKLQEGDDLMMGTTVVRIASSRARRVRAALADVDDGRVDVGMPVEVTLDAHPHLTFRGHVRDLSPVARPPAERSVRRVFQVGVDLDEAEADVLRPGLSVRVDVLIERREGALLAPRPALALAAPGEGRLHLADGRVLPVRVDRCSAALCAIEASAGDAPAVREGLPVGRAP
jgi:HlyD family secretion protein